MPLTILVLLRSEIRMVTLAMLWLPTNLTICVVVVNLESTLMADSLMFWNGNVEHCMGNEHIGISYHTLRDHCDVSFVLTIQHYSDWTPSNLEQSTVDFNYKSRTYPN